MTLIHEIRRQPHHVRMTLWALSTFTVSAVAGYLWFTSTQRELFFALHDDEASRTEFVEMQKERAPQPLAFVSRYASRTVAAIGGLMGFDGGQGFDRQPNEDKVYPLPLSN
jgi:hypothetical protein